MKTREELTSNDWLRLGYAGWRDGDSIEPGYLLEVIELNDAVLTLIDGMDAKDVKEKLWAALEAFEVCNENPEHRQELCVYLKSILSND